MFSDFHVSDDMNQLQLRCFDGGDGGLVSCKSVLPGKRGTSKSDNGPKNMLGLHRAAACSAVMDVSQVWGVAESSSSCKSTKELGRAGGYSQGRSREEQRWHFGRSFPHLRFDFAQDSQAFVSDIMFMI